MVASFAEMRIHFAETEPQRVATLSCIPSYPGRGCSAMFFLLMRFCSVAEKILCRFSKSMLLAYSYVTILFFSFDSTWFYASFDGFSLGFFFPYCGCQRPENIKAHRHRPSSVQLAVGTWAFYINDDSMCFYDVFI
jgi:hypothetical protein